MHFILFPVFNITLIPCDSDFSKVMQESYDAGDRKNVRGNSSHWVSSHRVQIVNLHMKMQFAPSKVYTIISCKRTHSFPPPQGKKDGIYHECGECLKDLETIFS